MSDKITIFVCGAPKTYCGCRGVAVDTCAFPLKGKKAGQLCDRPTCEKCLNGTTMCSAHQRWSREHATGSG